jgi:hypothetical protein
MRLKLLFHMVLTSILIFCASVEAKKKKGGHGDHSTPTKNSDRSKTGVTHRFFKAGWKSNGPAIIDENMKIEWKYESPDEISDAWMLNDGRVVFSFSRRKAGQSGIILIGADKEKKWEYLADDKRDNHSCQPLPNGNFLTGEVSDSEAFFVEVSPEGKKVSEIKVDHEATNKHHTFRMVRLTSEGTYLAPIMHGNIVKEFDKEGKLIRTFDGGQFTALRLPNGNTLTAGKAKGDAGYVTEYDKDGKVVWKLTKEDFENMNIRMKMICGIQRLANGNTVISNVSHGSITKSGDDYKVIEVTPAKELVWWVDMPELQKFNFGSIQIIDEIGDHTKFEILK